MIDLPDVLLPLGGAGLVASALAAWALARSLPDGAAPLARPGAAVARPRAIVGSLQLVAVGDYGCNEALRILTTLAQCGLDRSVGSLLIVQFSAQQRARFAQALPTAYTDRITYAYHEAYEDGFGNRAPEEVLAEGDAWVPVVREATAELIDLHERRNPGRAPGTILCLLSPGGHFPLGLVPVRLLRERYRAAVLVGATTLAHMSRLRGQFTWFKRQYEAAGLRGWLLTDTLGPDPDVADWALAGLVAGITDAAVQGQAGVQPTNVLNLLLPREPGGVIVWRTVTDRLVAFPWQRVPGLTPMRYFVFRQPLIERLQGALRRLAAGEGLPSTELPTGEPDTAEYDVVLLPIGHDDLTTIARAVRDGLRQRDALLREVGLVAPGPTGPGRPEADRATIFASVAARVDPQRPAAPLVLLRVAAVRVDAAPMAEIVKPPAERRLGMTGQLDSDTTSVVVPHPAPAAIGPNGGQTG